MTEAQVLAFIIVPVVAVAFGWGVALWARRAA
jgi:nitrate reductase NapE component